MWQEKMVVKSVVLHWHFSDETEENNGKTQSEHPMCRYSNLKPPEYKKKKKGATPPKKKKKKKRDATHSITVWSRLCVSPLRQGQRLYTLRKKSIHPFEVISSSTNNDREKLDIHKPNVPHIATSVTTNR